VPVKKKTKKQHPFRNISKKIITVFDQDSKKVFTRKHLFRLLALPSSKFDQFEEILLELKEKEMLELKGNHVRLIPQAEIVQGKISTHPRGFGFVQVKGHKQEVFIPKQHMDDAIEGDIVEIEIDPKVSSKGPEGKIVRVLERSRKILAGTILKKHHHHYVVYAPILGPERLIDLKCTKKDTFRIGDRLVMEIKKWKRSTNQMECVPLQYLGSIEDPSIDVLAAIYEFEIPHQFSKKAIQEAKKLGGEVKKKDLNNRKDFTKLTCITIDPDTAKDYDDAISLTVDSKGNFQLGVHIADAAFYVKPDSYLDKEAHRRGNSTYFPGVCVPMLPEELSNQLCSLKAGVIRLTVSVLMTFTPKGDLEKYEIHRAYIKSKKRFTYNEAFDVLEKRKKSPHAPLLQNLAKLGALLRQKRMERGSIDFALPEAVIKVDKKGNPERIEIVEYDITHQMIEEFMLKANEVVAEHLAQKKKMLIYRIHEEPPAENFHDFYHLARSLGFRLPDKPNHRDIQKLFHQAKKTPYFQHLSISFIRSMKIAFYSPDNLGHYGLSLEHYCHFTSPIRRYSDLIIERLLFKDKTPEDLSEIANHCSYRERMSFRAEMAVVQLKKLRLLNKTFQEDPTHIFEASITKIKPFAIFFEITDFFLEGCLFLSDLDDDYFVFEPNTVTLRGKRTGRKYSFGDKIQVILTQIDFVLLESKWILANQERPKARKKAKKKGRRKRR